MKQVAANPLADLIERAYDEARPITVQLELTYKCNLLCSFCYNAPKERSELTTEQWVEAVGKLKSAGTFTVSLTGGEPMIHPGFWEIAQKVREQGLVLKTYTNGVLLADRKRAERYAELAPFDTEISLHGSEASTHDRLTGIRGSFDKLMVALGHLSELGVKVSLKTPITRLNQAQLRDVEQLGLRYGYHVSFDTNITPTDDGDTSPLSMAADPKFLVDFFVDQVQRGKRGINPRPVQKMKQNCGTGRTTMAIDPYGDMFPCIAWRRPIANILEADDVADVWNGRKGHNATLAYVRKVADEVPKKTLTAPAEGAFASFCPAVAEKETGSPYSFYKGAKLSGLTKLTAFQKIAADRADKGETNGEEGLAPSAGSA